MSRGRLVLQIIDQGGTKVTVEESNINVELCILALRNLGRISGTSGLRIEACEALASYRQPEESGRITV